jgi:bifunctional non-homologous end joining protein LigD
VLATTVPVGDGWLHELKHDGFRIVALKEGDEVRLWSRNGRDWSAEFAAITVAVIALPFARIVLDGEAVAAARKGNALLGPHGCASACLYAFDLLRLGGPLALSERRALLRKHLRKAAPALIYSEHMESRTPRRYSGTPAPWASRASNADRCGVRGQG